MGNIKINLEDYNHFIVQSSQERQHLINENAGFRERLNTIERLSADNSTYFLKMLGCIRWASKELVKAGLVSGVEAENMVENAVIPETSQRAKK
jgi:hypothetical protein